METKILSLLNRSLCFLWILLLSLVPIASLAEDFDRLGLAQTLIRDGNIDRAQKVLVDAKKLLDDDERSSWHLLQSLVYLRSGRAAEALLGLSKVRAKSLVNKRNIYRTEAYLVLERFEDALKSSQSFEITRYSPKSLYELKARVFYSSGNWAELISLLTSMEEVHPESAARLTIYYYLEMGTFLEAHGLMMSYLKGPYGSAKRALQFANSFLERGSQKQAIRLLEYASIRWDSNSEIKAVLARIYRNQNMRFVGRDLMIAATYLDSSYLEETIAVLKDGQWLSHAENLVLLVSDPVKKLRHQLEIFIAREEFAKARSLHSSLVVHGLYKDDEVLYALAYSFLTMGEVDSSIKLLGQISDAKLLSKSIKLIELARECQAQPWVCHATL